MLHEFAHFYNYEVMDRKTYNEWKKLSEDSNYSITEYSQVNYKEDFAEVFAESFSICYNLSNIENQQYIDFFEKNVIDSFVEC